MQRRCKCVFEFIKYFPKLREFFREKLEGSVGRKESPMVFKNKSDHDYDQVSMITDTWMAAIPLYFPWLDNHEYIPYFSYSKLLYTSVKHSRISQSYN